MSSVREKRKRLLTEIFAVLLTVCFLFLVFKLITVIDANVGHIGSSDDDLYAYSSGVRPEYLVDGKWYVQKGTIETYLLIGIDKFEADMAGEGEYLNHEQSDALLLLALDRINESYSLIQINRDTMANIRMLDLFGNPFDTKIAQLALSHTYGSGREDSCENTVWAVSNYLYGLQIDHYASVSMDAIAVLNDKIGGVTLTVADDMTVVDATLEQGATVTLKGEQALSYVRARGSLADSSNVARMGRQRQYISEFLTQAQTALSEHAGLAADIVLSLSDYLVSDLTAEEFLLMTDVMNHYSFAGITAIEGEAHVGEQYMEFYADEAALQKLILDTFYVEK